MTTRTVTSFCRICEALCGVLVDVEDDLIVGVRGDPDHVSSRGYLCPKGAAMARVVNDPDRVLFPLQRQPDGSYKSIDWDAALDGIANRLLTVIDEYGPESVGCYSGNPLGFGPASHMWNKKLADGIGFHHTYSAATQDSTSRYVANYYLFGNPMALPIPDFGHTTFLLCVGANPVVSQGSLVSVGRIKDQLNDIVARGGRIVVVDPARTATARAYEHLPIHPGSDAWLFAGMLNTIFDEGLVDPDVSGVAVGIEDLRTAIAPYTVELAGTKTGIDAESIRKLARDFASAPSAAAHGRLGICRGRTPTLTNYLLDALNVITGNFDKRGGVILGTGLVDWATMMARMGRTELGVSRTRVGDLPVIIGRPSLVISDEISTPGPGQLRAMFLIAGNPVSSTPAGARLAEAFEQLDLLVSIDLYINESNGRADYILPAATFLERPDLMMSFGGNMPRPWTQLTEPAVAPRGDAREEWWIINELLVRLGHDSPGDPWDTIRDIVASSPEAQKYGLTLDEIAKYPHGVSVGGEAPVGIASERISLYTGGATDKVQLGAPDVLGLLPLLNEPLRDSADQLLLVGRRDLRSMNSWMHNVRPVRRGNVPTLDINPRDAEPRGIADGDIVEVSTSIGSISVPARVTDDLMPGTVSYPHGWGHKGAWTTAVAHGGANVNSIIPNEIELKERLSGMSYMDGVPVTVTPANDPTTEH